MQQKAVHIGPSTADHHQAIDLSTSNYINSVFTNYLLGLNFVCLKWGACNSMLKLFAITFSTF